MATLPDLPTSNISFVTYWNAIDDGGVTSIDPEQVVSATGVNDYTLYDNGVEGNYTSQEMQYPREFKYRVKNDGWVITYMDRSATFDTEVPRSNSDPSAIRGPWDIARDWTYGNSPPDVQQSVLERAINKLQAEFSNSGNITYNSTDVGLYNYEYPGGTTLTNLAQGGNTGNVGFSYTSGTDIKWHVATGHGYYSGNSSWGVFAPSGTEIAYVNSFNPEREWGVLDMLANNESPNAATEYVFDISASGDSGDGSVCHSNLIVWG